MKNLPVEVIKAYDRWREIDSRYPCNAGAYDRKHGDNIALGIRWKKMVAAIATANLPLESTLWTLSNTDL